MKKMSKEEVAAIVPGQVHEIIGSVMLADGFPIVVDMARSQGQIIYDSKENKPYLDFFSYFASNPIGHNHPRMTEPEFVAKLGRAAVEKPSNSDVYTVEMAQFVATFHRVAMPDDMQHLFLISGGGLAIENAIKAAMDWKIRKNIEAGKGEIGTKVIHLKDAFHGRTGYTLTLTNTANPNKYKYYAKFDWPRISCPAAKFPLEGKNLDDTIAAEKKALEEIESIFKADADNICSFIIEPVQGEGGVHPATMEFLQDAQQLCHMHDCILIIDEVQTGFGRTGKMFALEHFNLQPDILCLAKSIASGIPMGATLLGERVKPLQPGIHGSTFGGNPIAISAAIATLEVLQEEKLAKRADVLGQYLMNELKKLESPLIREVRGMGLMVGIELRKKAAPYIQALAEQGILVLSAGMTVIRLLPPLVITKEQLDEVITKIAFVLNAE